MTDSTDEWYTAIEAQEVLGMSRRHLDRLANSGEIKSVMKAGKKRYRPEDVDELEVPEAKPLPDPLEQNQKHLEMVMKHYDKLLTNINAPLETITAAWRDEMLGMRSRVEQLEKVHLDVVKERESLATDSSLRALALSDHEAGERRKDEAWATFKGKVLPKLIGNHELNGFVASLKDEQIQALTESDFFDQQQVEVIRRLRANASNGASKPAPDASTTEGKN